MVGMSQAIVTPLDQKGGCCHVELGQVRALGREATPPLQSDVLLILLIAVIKPYDQSNL